MGKNGRSYWPIKRQVATADRIANKGNLQERISLMERELTIERIRARLEVAPDNSAARAAANPR